MRPPISELQRQFDRANTSGWISLVRAAADQYQFTVELLLGIGSRETNLEPQYQVHPGDHGRGFSMWQIDIGSDAEWIATGDWKDVGKAVMRAAFWLDQKRTDVTDKLKHPCVEKKLSAVVVSNADIERITVAAYNTGAARAVSAYLNFKNPDRFTTGADYSADVLYRRDVFASFLSNMKGQS